MRIVFFGATELGYRCCDELLTMGQQVVGLFTIERDFKISYSPNKPVRNFQFQDFHELGATHGIPVTTVTGKLSDYESVLAALDPDLIVVVGWYHMIPRKLRNIARRGCVGIHASLLPRFRGGAPLVWAMIEGEEITGVTLFYFDDGVDDGDVIGQQSFPIGEHDTIATLLKQAEAGSLSLIKKFVPMLETGTAPRIPQDHASATSYPQRSPADGEIDWLWDAHRIDRFIRAQTKPYPGAYTEISGKRITIWAAQVENVPEESGQ